MLTKNVIFGGRCRLFRMMDKVEGFVDYECLFGAIFGLLYEKLLFSTADSTPATPDGDDANKNKLSEMLLLIEDEIKPYKKELKRMEGLGYVGYNLKSICLAEDLIKLKATIELYNNRVGAKSEMQIEQKNGFSSLFVIFFAGLIWCPMSSLKRCF